jgi:hypothetical protein
VDLGNLAKFTNLAYAMMTARHWPWVAARNSCKEEFNREGRNADGPRATRFSVIRIIHYLHYVGSRPVFSEFGYYRKPFFTRTPEMPVVQYTLQPFRSFY